MSRVSLVAALAATALLTGCAGGGATARNTSHQSIAPKPAPKPLTRAQLKAGLVTLADLPTGYVVDPSPDSGGDTKMKAATPACQTQWDVLEKASNSGGIEAKAAFQKEGGTTLKQSWEAVAEPMAQISREFESFRRLLAQCGKVTVVSTDGTPPISITFGSLALPDIGDDRFGLSGRGVIQGINISISVAVVRVDKNIEVVVQGGLGEGDVPLLQKVAALGVTRLPQQASAA